MKYIKTLKTERFSILKDIRNGKINVNFLFFDNFNQEELEQEYNTIDKIKELFIFFDDLKTIENIDDIKKDIFFNMAIKVANIVISQNSYDEFSRKIILNNQEAAFKVSQHIGEPLEGSEELFFNENNLKNKPLEDDLKIFNSYLYFYNYIYYILIPHYKKIFPNDYRKVLINKYEDHFFRNFSHNRKNKAEIFDMFIKCISELYQDIFSKKVASKIFYIQDRLGYKSIENIEHYMKFVVFPHIKKTEDKDQLEDIFYNPNGKYHHFYKLIIDSDISSLAFDLVKFIKKRGTPELEKIILKSSNHAREYSKIGYFTFGDPELDKKIKSPVVAVKYLKDLKTGRTQNKILEDYILNGDSKINFSYFKNVLKSNWIGNEDIKERIENKISENVFTSGDYLFEMINKIPKNQRTPQFIKNYVDNNYARFRDIIINGRIFYLISRYESLIT